MRCLAARVDIKEQRTPYQEILYMTESTARTIYTAEKSQLIEMAPVLVLYLEVVDVAVGLVTVRSQEPRIPLARSSGSAGAGDIVHLAEIHHRVLVHAEARRARRVHALHLCMCIYGEHVNM